MSQLALIALTLLADSAPSPSPGAAIRARIASDARAGKPLVAHVIVAQASGPSWTWAAPRASEVCSGWRPCTWRPQQAQWPTWKSNRRTIVHGSPYLLMVGVAVRSRLHSHERASRGSASATASLEDCRPVSWLSRVASVPRSAGRIDARRVYCSERADHSRGRTRPPRSPRTEPAASLRGSRSAARSRRRDQEHPLNNNRAGFYVEYIPIGQIDSSHANFSPLPWIKVRAGFDLILTPESPRAGPSDEAKPGAKASEVADRGHCARTSPYSRLCYPLCNVSPGSCRQCQDQEEC